MGSAGQDPLKAMSESAMGRHAMVANAEQRLRAIAHRGLYERNLPAKEFVVICIAVDSQWRDFVEHIMPGHEETWRQQRMAGAQPLALGIVAKANTYFAEQFPNLREVILEEPEPGKAKLIAIDDTGATVYNIAPKAESGNA